MVQAIPLYARCEFLQFVRIKVLAILKRRGINVPAVNSLGYTILGPILNMTLMIAYSIN